MTDFNLSEKVCLDIIIRDIFYLKDVKEAVRLFKDDIKPDETDDPFILFSDVIKKINKRFGEKLT